MTLKRPEEFDFLDPALQRCPFEFYRSLRTWAPVYREPATGYYIVSRYDDILEVKRNPVLFSNDYARAVSQKKPPPEALAIYRQGMRRPATLQRSDPPAHARYRKLIGKTFTVSRVRALGPDISRVVHDLIDAFPATGEVDFASAFGVPLPCFIIADQLGVPRDQALMLKLWSDALLDPVGLMITPEREIECARQTLDFQRYFAAAIEERRARPRDDILSDLSSRIEGEDPFSVEEVVNMIEQIMTGGNESTTGLLGSAMLMLCRHPAQQEFLRENPEQVENFIEEALRTETPVQSNFRLVTDDTTLAGVALPKGAVLVLRYAAANRDERKFADPETFDVCRRDARAHISFGAGIHHCPGGMLAREEARIAFTELLRRFDSFELAVDESELRYHPTFFLRGLRSLPLRLTPRRDSGASH
jgi:cytochrome P450